jgi:hypothetical protein
VDIDGVLANLVKFVKELTGHTLKDSDTYDQETWNKFHDYMRAGNKTFQEFEMLPDAQKLWDFVKPYKPHILSATGTNLISDVRKQKTAWVKKHLTGYDQIHLPDKSRDKAKWAWPDAILIDDRMKSIGPWREKGGIGILHKSAADTIKQLKKLGL